MNILNRKTIANGVFLSTVTDGRFKKNRISLSFLTQSAEDTESLDFVIPTVITNSCKAHPTLQLLNSALAELYGASLSVSPLSLGDATARTINISTLDNRYALEGEDLIGDCVQILLDCVFEPLTNGDSFIESIVETEKQACIDEIEAELNDKRSYAVRKASQLMYKGEGAAVRPTVEGVAAVTAKSLFERYQELLRTARIEIFCVGCNDFDGVADKFAAAFTGVDRSTVSDCYSQVSPAKSTPLACIEEMEVNQSKLVMGWKTDNSNEFAVNLMTKIYGGSPTAKLFENVRERMSLCYYCLARNSVLKGAMVAECGVEASNIKTAKDEILNQLDLMKKGEFSDIELEQALLAFENDLKAISNKLSMITVWYLGRIFKCDVITPETAAEKYRAVTREQIIAAAESFTFDTLYMLVGSEDGASDDIGNMEEA